MKMLDPWKARGLKMVDDLPRKPLTLADIKTKRWTKKGNGRLLPLNSDAWRKLRAQVLAEVPLCEYCPPGVITPATEVDHANFDPSDNRRENLKSTCKPCHSIRTMADLYGRPARMGCDEHGNPINPAHPWNEKSRATDSPEPTGSPSFNAPCLKNRQS